MPKTLKVPGIFESTDVESTKATIIIGWYTFISHLIIGFYFLDVYRGNASNYVPSPIFEYSKDHMYSIAFVLAVYCLLFMFFGSLGLIRGVKTETRIYYFPWLAGSALELMLLFYQSIYILWKYSYDPYVILISLVMMFIASYHWYLYLIVLSNYKYLTRIQNPTLIFPPDM